MARTHANAYKAIEGVQIVAGVDSNSQRLATFCDEFAIENRFSSVEEAIQWDAFDAASNVTPDGVHFATTIPLVDAGKHVLCEKPLAANYRDALEMAEKAKAAGIVNCVNLSYREVPALQKAASLVADGAIGAVRHFEASYLQSWLSQPAWGDWKTEEQWLWRLSTKHGSNGVLGDVGIHILDFATFAAGCLPTKVSAQLHTFSKAPNNRIGEYELDANDSFVMHAQLPDGALGTISATRFATGHLNDLRLRLYGDKGGLEVLFEDRRSQLNACLGDNINSPHWELIHCPAIPSNYQQFIDEIQTAQPKAPNFQRGADLQKILDQLLLGG